MQIWLKDHCVLHQCDISKSFDQFCVVVLLWLHFEHCRKALTSTQSGRLNVYGYCSLDNRWLTAMSQIQFIHNQRRQVMLIWTEWWLETEGWTIFWREDQSRWLFHDWPWRQKQKKRLPSLISSSPSSSSPGLWLIIIFILNWSIESVFHFPEFLILNMTQKEKNFHLMFPRTQVLSSKCLFPSNNWPKMTHNRFHLLMTKIKLFKRTTLLSQERIH